MLVLCGPRTCNNCETSSRGEGRHFSARAIPKRRRLIVDLSVSSRIPSQQQQLRDRGVVSITASLLLVVLALAVTSFVVSGTPADVDAPHRRAPTPFSPASSFCARPCRPEWPANVCRVRSTARSKAAPLRRGEVRSKQPQPAARGGVHGRFPARHFSSPV